MTAASFAASRMAALRSQLSSVRGRALVVVVTITALTVLAIGAVTHWVRLGQLETSVVQGTEQEAGELQRLLDRGPASASEDQADRVPTELPPEDAYDSTFDSVEHLLWTFMSTSVPAHNEVIVGVVDGDVRYTYDGPAGEGLSPEAIEEVVREHGQPGRTVHTMDEHDDRDIGFGLIHVDIAGDEQEGYLVVATDITAARADIIDSWWRYVLISLLFLVAASAVAYFLIGRVTAPISRLREATESISAHDLSERVQVPGQDSDISNLAENFNSMLDRIQTGFEEQRQFLDDAAHELRTPLTILQGNLELMDEDDPKDAAETRDLMLDEIGRMNRLVEDLLLLAKSRRPDFIRPAPMEVEAFMDDACARVSALSAQRRWLVDVSTDGALSADRERLMQAVIQLAANAVKHTDEGDTIALGAMWVDDARRAGSRRLELWVRDTGEGIAHADQLRIFERFGRAAAGRTVEGSGLGLSIVSAIAAGHGGRVGLRSSPGRGSWFTLHLPEHGPSADGSDPAAVGGAVPEIQLDSMPDSAAGEIEPRPAAGP
ncbi:cell wall metabolism sensor histidine kinase WalK [Kocuria palustris]|uniref:sensor histidine kinase n=1 Tax=Kocuria palustris TaxID=71999 RepID=UPI0011A7AA70|nr:HAMP domain-containing sensor histidine kinase [Kocuria palustris]